MGGWGGAPHRACDCCFCLELKAEGAAAEPSVAMAWDTATCLLPGSSSRELPVREGSRSSGLEQPSTITSRGRASTPSAPIRHNGFRDLRRHPQKRSVATKRSMQPPLAHSGWCYPVVHIQLFCSAIIRRAPCSPPVGWSKHARSRASFILAIVRLSKAWVIISSPYPAPARFLSRPRQMFAAKRGFSQPSLYPTSKNLIGLKRRTARRKHCASARGSASSSWSQSNLISLCFTARGISPSGMSS